MTGGPGEPGGARRAIELSVDGTTVSVPEGATLLEACRRAGVDTPTLCYGETLEPANVCRVCVVEVEGVRALAPACSRPAEAGMVVSTDTSRVRAARRGVLELLGSSVDLSTAPAALEAATRYGARPERFGPPAGPDPHRDRRWAGVHDPPAGPAASVEQPVKVDNDLYVRDYAKCILCYQCVDACGDQWQHTFAIAVAGRGFDARISTEFAVDLPESACVYCGNCIAVCPTGALMVRAEHDLRAAGEWHDDRQTVTRTVCPYCGVGCNLELHVQDGRIVKVTSPHDHDVTGGNLCVKGRFGFPHVRPDGQAGRAGSPGAGDDPGARAPHHGSLGAEVTVWPRTRSPRGRARSGRSARRPRTPRWRRRSRTQRPRSPARPRR